MNRHDTPPTVVYEGKYQRMVVRGTWEYSERVHAGGLAAIIVAVTPDDAMLFVEQFRVPLQARTIEMPAGLVGDIHADESIELSAIRELEEETGWTAEHAEVLMIGPTSAGASSEKIAFVRATGLRKVGEGGGRCQRRHHRAQNPACAGRRLAGAEDGRGLSDGPQAVGRLVPGRSRTGWHPAWLKPQSNRCSAPMIRRPSPCTTRRPHRRGC